MYHLYSCLETKEKNKRNKLTLLKFDHPEYSTIFLKNYPIRTHVFRDGALTKCIWAVAQRLFLSNKNIVYISIGNVAYNKQICNGSP